MQLLNFMSYHQLLMFSQKCRRICLLAQYVLIMLISPYGDAYFVTAKLFILRGQICYSFFISCKITRYTHTFINMHVYSLLWMNSISIQSFSTTKATMTNLQNPNCIICVYIDESPIQLFSSFLTPSAQQKTNLCSYDSSSSCFG